jgi:adenylate cyclase
MGWRWLPPIDYGTQGYPEKVARRLRAVNVAAWIAGLVPAFFAILRLTDPGPGMLRRGAINAALAIAVFSLPLLHRFGSLVAPLAMVLLAYAFLFRTVWQIGTDGGGWLYYLSATALLILLIGFERLWLCIALSAAAAGLIVLLHVVVPDNAGLVSDRSVFFGNFIFNVVANTVILFVVTWYAMRQVASAEARAEHEYARSEQLLTNILPQRVAERLKDKGSSFVADRYDDASVMFVDLAGFTSLAGNTAPGDLVRFLNGVFSRLDQLVEQHGLEKIKTSGDAYMVVSGVPEPRADHAAALADFAIAARAQLTGLVDPSGRAVSVRIGIASGPVVAGVVGTRKFFYDVWGDTVNTASRMESTGEAGRIQVAPDTYELLKAGFELQERGTIDVRGKGAMRTWFLLCRRG